MLESDKFKMAGTENENKPTQKWPQQTILHSGTSSKKSDVVITKTYSDVLQFCMSL